MAPYLDSRKEQYHGHACGSDGDAILFCGLRAQRGPLRSGEYTQAWEELLGSWFPRSGYEPDSRPFYERYVIEEDFRSYDVMSVEFCAALMPLQ